MAACGAGSMKKGLGQRGNEGEMGAVPEFCHGQCGVQEELKARVPERQSLLVNTCVCQCVYVGAGTRNAMYARSGSAERFVLCLPVPQSRLNVHGSGMPPKSSIRWYQHVIEGQTEVTEEEGVMSLLQWVGEEGELREGPAWSLSKNVHPMATMSAECEWLAGGMGKPGQCSACLRPGSGPAGW